MMNRFLITFLFLQVIFLSLCKAQNVTEVAAGVKMNSIDYYSYTAQIGRVGKTNKVGVDIGTEFLVALDGQKIHYNFAMGIEVKIFSDTLGRRWNRFFSFAFDYINYKYDSIVYDMAVPNILLEGTLVHKVVKVDFPLGYGVRYSFYGKFYCEAVAGINMSIWKHWDPTEKYYGDEKPKTRNAWQIFGAIRLGYHL